MREKPLPQEQEAPIGVSLVFDHNGQTQTTAPPAPNQGTPQSAESPAQPPPPPPAPPQEEVNLNMPPNVLASLPPPPPRPRPPVIARSRPELPHHSMMMLNGMSFGSPSTSAPAPAQRNALNLALPQTDAQAVMGPEVTVKGDIGADWMSELNDWVNAHKYYPAAAAEQNQQGSVQIEFTVDRHGNVTGLHMLNSSGYNFLDLAWMGMFQGVKLPPFPPGTKSDHITVDATMQYELVNPTP